MSGGVLVNKKIKVHDKPLDFSIPNETVRAEFDAVKNYFGNVLNTKKISVTATIEFSDYQLTAVQAVSPEIDKINKELIEDVKFEFLKATKKKNRTDIDKNLFTMDEYLDTFSDDKSVALTLFKDEKTFFEALLKKSNTKHYRHLRFLSDKHLHTVMKLRFIHRPLSFIFLLQGVEYYHIVWETLDTEEATYIWLTAKENDVLKMKMQQMEKIINGIRVHGKAAYLATADVNFNRVYHDYTDVDYGFFEMESDLENYLA